MAAAATARRLLSVQLESWYRVGAVTRWPVTAQSAAAGGAARVAGAGRAGVVHNPSSRARSSSARTMLFIACLQRFLFGDMARPGGLCPGGLAGAGPRY